MAFYTYFLKNNPGIFTDLQLHKGLRFVSGISRYSPDGEFREGGDGARFAQRGLPHVAHSPPETVLIAEPELQTNHLWVGIQLSC